MNRLAFTQTDQLVTFTTGFIPMWKPAVVLEFQNCEGIFYYLVTNDAMTW